MIFMGIMDLRVEDVTEEVVQLLQSQETFCHEGEKVHG